MMVINQSLAADMRNSTTVRIIRFAGKSFDCHSDVVPAITVLISIFHDLREI